METYDLVIRNGLVVMPEKVLNLDIGIRNGKIAALTLPRMLIGKVVEDASGKIVFPGGVDVHVHMDDLGAEEHEDWKHGSYAAACGGITTVVDMPIDCIPVTLNSKNVREKINRIKGNAYTDYLLWGGLTTNNLSEIDGMLEAGVVGLKSFLIDIGMKNYPKTNDPILFEAMIKSKQKGFPIMIHAEDEEMNRYYEEKYKGSCNWYDWTKMHPLHSELVAVEKSILFAKLTSARVHFAHLSSVESIERVKEAKAQGINVSCETCPHYLMFCDEDYEEKGALLKCSPPVRGKDNLEGLWKLLSNGEIDIISSDHSPNNKKRSAELKNRTIDEIWSGVSGIQNTLYVLFSEGYKKGRLTLQKIAEVSSLNPAKLLGISRDKGSIEIGKDADLVILNPNIETQFDEKQIKTKIKDSVYKDICFSGHIEKTFLRGIRITENNPRGHYIRR